MWFKGLKFGMLLQLAVGPMCLMVFNTAKEHGFLKAFTLVAAIAFVDALYILLAAIGVGTIINKEKIKRTIKIVGSSILCIFAINIILNVFGVNIIPGLNIAPSSANIFVQGLVLTLSNPLTIIFWSSILTTKIIEDKMNKRDIFIFSIGCVCATLIFLSIVAILGMIISSFIPDMFSKILNVIVGLILIFFAVKLLVKKDEAK